ncbi:hypothetical protein GJ631_01155 [Natronomonas sp. CBA1123]|uniref:hypothetical protein n=1 Tax=Natronomonas sp. CBA1123 TaxID=2668070 RepID=UPI0012EAE2BD|nr:hypothetical protein [Natronomonas sp. CBA1123]MUV85225.1 hypothetical protein [Natronomonas sp. CBA1123]
MTQFGTLRERLRRAVENSWVVRVSSRTESTLSRWGIGSRIVQWFLAEPEPEVIVIDLRETYTIGPILRAIEWALGHGNRLAERSGLTAAVRKAAQWAHSQPIHLVGIVLFGVAVAGLASAALSSGAFGRWLVLSGIALLAVRERRSWDEIRDTRVGRALAAAFAPPDPPDDNRQQPDSETE